MEIRLLKLKTYKAFVGEFSSRYGKLLLKEQVWFMPFSVARSLKEDIFWNRSGLPGKDLVPLLVTFMIIVLLLQTLRNPYEERQVLSGFTDEKS